MKARYILTNITDLVTVEGAHERSRTRPPGPRQLLLRRRGPKGASPETSPKGPPSHQDGCLCSKTYPITEGTHPPPRQSAVLGNLFVLESGRRDGQNRAAILPESRISGALRNEWKEADLAETTARSTIDVAQAARRSYR